MSGCRALNDISCQKVQKTTHFGVVLPHPHSVIIQSTKLFSMDDMRYDLDKFKLELPDKMKNIVKERQYKWQFCSEIIEF